MAHSTAIPAAQQTPKAQFDWYTFLCSAFINGLKAYGASLMVTAPSTACESQIPFVQPKLTDRHLAITTPQSSPALPHTALAKPALTQAWTRA